MSGKNREAEKNLGLVMSPTDVGYLVPMDNLNVGPGKPGPEDDWHVPAEPAVDGTARPAELVRSAEKGARTPRK